VLSDIAAAPAAGSSNIVTTGAINSGSITSGFGAINNGSSAITTTGTVTFGSLSDGSITVTAFVDEDNMASDSATLVPTQQSVKAFVEATVGSNITTTGALNSGSITSGFGTIDTGSSNITTTGTGSFGVLNATDGCTITTADNTAQLKLESTDADANVGPILEMTRNSSSPADNDILARIDFKGDNDAAEETFFGSINAVATDVSNGAEDGQIKHRVMVNGTVTSVLDLDASGASVTGGGTFSSSSSGEFNAITISQADNTSGNESRIRFKRTTDAGSDREVAAIVADRIGGNDTDVVIEVNTDGSDGAVEKFRFNHNGTLFSNNVFGLDDGDTGIAFGVNVSNCLQFYTGNSEKARINSDGRLGIGTSSPLSALHVDAAIDSSPAAKGVHIGMSSNYAAMEMSGSDGGFIDFQDAVDGNDHSGRIIYAHSDDAMRFSTAGGQRLIITSGGQVNIGSTTSTRSPLVIANSSSQISLTDADGTSNIVDIKKVSGPALTIDIGGSEKARFVSTEFLVGMTTANGLGGKSDVNGVEVGPGYININRDDTSTVNTMTFGKNNSIVGSISTTGSGTTYNTTSDIRLKQDIEPLQATDKLMAMNPVSYAWKVDPDGPRSMGFIAQEMKEVMPEVVSIGNDDEGMMSMDYGRITPILVSALQDAHKKIEELENRIAAMENK